MTRISHQRSANAALSFSSGSVSVVATASGSIGKQEVDVESNFGSAILPGHLDSNLGDFAVSAGLANPVEQDAPNAVAPHAIMGLIWQSGHASEVEFAGEAFEPDAGDSARCEDSSSDDLVWIPQGNPGRNAATFRSWDETEKFASADAKLATLNGVLGNSEALVPTDVDSEMHACDTTGAVVQASDRDSVLTNALVFFLQQESAAQHGADAAAARTNIGMDGKSNNTRNIERYLISHRPVGQQVRLIAG